MPASRPAPTNSRVMLRARGLRRWRVLARGSADVGDLGLVVVGLAGGLVGELDRGQGDLHQVELVGERLDDDAEAVQVALDQAPRARARVSSSRRARRSATVGSFSIAIGCPVTRSIVLSMRCSRGSASVIATPSRPARPTRPMRCDVGLGRRRARRS